MPRHAAQRQTPQRLTTDEAHMTRRMTCTVSSISPYSPSKFHDAPKLNKEAADAYDERTWREKAHYDPSTREVYIPQMAFKFSLCDAAKRLAIKIPGKRNALYTSRILSGTICESPVYTGVTIDAAEKETVHCHASGQRGSGARVFRRFPIIPHWTGQLAMLVIDDEIPSEVLEVCLKEAGSVIGIGRFRPQQGGFLGRYAVSNFSWQSFSDAIAA